MNCQNSFRRFVLLVVLFGLYSHSVNADSPKNSETGWYSVYESYHLGGGDLAKYFDEPEAARKMLDAIMSRETKELILHQALSFSNVCTRFNIDCAGFEEGEVRALFTAAIEEKRRAYDRSSNWYAALGGALAGGIVSVLIQLSPALFARRNRTRQNV